MTALARCCGLPFLITMAVSFAARADDVVKFPQPPNFARYAYHYELLEAVLKRTVDEYGSYVAEPYTTPLSTDRIVKELVKGENINVLALDVGNDFVNENTIPVPYPIDKGLIGYRAPRGVIEAPQELAMLHDVYPDLVSRTSC